MTAAQGSPSRAATVAVIVPTVGRASTVRKLVGRLAQQSRRPERVLVIGAAADDIAGLEDVPAGVEVHLGPRGSCSQRNRGLDLLGGRADFVAFFDDDFIPSHDYFAKAEQLFSDHADVVGANGRVIADGDRGPGISFDEAESLLAAHTRPNRPARIWPREALYGCNMVFRGAAIGDLRFDEALPLYGWQEDIDFSYRVGRGGRLVRCPLLFGVHMAEKTGRTSGRRFGYSQIANPIYLMRKATIPREDAMRLMRNNVMSNFWRSLNPEPYIDRRGRLSGNLMAMRDWLTGRIDPRNILQMK